MAVQWVRLRHYIIGEVSKSRYYINVAVTKDRVILTVAVTGSYYINGTVTKDCVNQSLAVLNVWKSFGFPAASSEGEVGVNKQAYDANEYFCL